jgi:hypothetical protein
MCEDREKLKKKQCAVICERQVNEEEKRSMILDVRNCCLLCGGNKQQLLTYTVVPSLLAS